MLNGLGSAPTFDWTPFLKGGGVFIVSVVPNSAKRCSEPLTWSPKS